jgi:hypothetical protein
MPFPTYRDRPKPPARHAVPGSDAFKHQIVALEAVSL